MKNICFFITHKTLDLIHASCTIESLRWQKLKYINHKPLFDKLYIYNSHKNEVSNIELLYEIFGKYYGCANCFDDIDIFKYDDSTHKSLGGDLSAIKNYCNSTYDVTDRILLLKSDCILSPNYFLDIANLPKDRPVFFTAPWVCTKSRVSPDEYMEYAKRDRFVPSDDETFFVEDQTNSSNNDFKSRPEVSVTDSQIKYISCTVNTDYSCHYMDVGLMNSITIQHQSWGGAKFHKLLPYYIGTENSFVVHQYHDIVSENRESKREGPIEHWLNS